MQYLIKIGGVPLPIPVTYEVSLSDLDSENSARSETGVMNRQRIRGDVAKLQLGFENMSTDELTIITDAITPEEFQVDFFFGGWKTATMYCGDKSIKLRPLTNEENASWDISFGLVEY